MAFNYYQWREEYRDFPCAFAKLILDSLGPSAVLFQDAPGVSATDIAKQIDAITRAAVRSSARVLTIHVPAWNERLMVETFAALGGMEGWQVKKLKPISYQSQDLAAIGLHFELSPGGTKTPKIETVPMLLGPFVTCPPSRFCPEPILEMSIDRTCVKEMKDGTHRADFLRLPTPKMNSKQRIKQEGAVQTRSREMNKGLNPSRLANITVITSSELAALL